MPNRINIGFVPLYNVNYASSRFRVFQYFYRLRRLGIGCYYVPAPLMNNIKRLVYLPKLFALSRSCDVLYLQKRLLPIWILRLITRVNNNILFDFDDAIYLQESRIEPLHEVLRTAKVVVAGNKCLSEYAKKFNQSIAEIPTVIDTDHYLPSQGEKHPAEPRVLIGWIGSDPNRGDLDLITPSLDKIGYSFHKKVALLIIARHSYSRKTSIPQIFIPWTLHTYHKALQKIDIGIMPLDNTEWNKGKCAFKLIQYSSVKAVSIASPVGMNTAVVLPSKTGFLADTQEEWYDKLSLLIQDAELRSKLGQNGRFHIEQHYSVEACLPKLVDAIEFVARM
jgi:glycosyltransferase involved in cell wall biosynthesis